MQYNAKTILAVSVMSILVTFVIGQATPALAQTVPTSSNLVKRDYSYTDDLHLTAAFGNTRVCGDHLCAPGEWTKLQESLNHAQITHASGNSTTNTSTPSENMTTHEPTNSTIPVPSNETQTMPVPPPAPTPEPTPYSICTAVKTALGNSTVPSDVVSKVMADLGCTS